MHHDLNALAEAGVHVSIFTFAQWSKNGRLVFRVTLKSEAPEQKVEVSADSPHVEEALALALTRFEPFRRLLPPPALQIEHTKEAALNDETPF